jgi:hypothetical protein
MTAAQATLRFTRPGITDIAFVTYRVRPSSSAPARTRLPSIPSAHRHTWRTPEKTRSPS